MRYTRIIFGPLVLTSAAACDGRVPTEPAMSAPLGLSREAVPTGITASASSPTRIDVSWQKGTGSIMGYQVFRSTTGPAGSFDLLAVTSQAATAWSDVNLAASTQYCYEVRSYRTVGRNTVYSSYSSVACATTLAPPLTAPSGVDAMPVRDDYFPNPSSSRIRVSWRDNSTNEDGFRIERAWSLNDSWTLIATTPANATSLSTSMAREQQVCYRVTAFGAAGSSSPSTPDCTTAPQIVTNLMTKTGADLQSIELTWSDNSAVEDGYTVSRRDVGDAWTEVATLPANSVRYRDAGVRADVTYTYRVLAMKDGGYSDDSNLATGIVPTSAPTAAPSNAAAGYDSDPMYGWLYFGIAWTDLSSNEEGFRVEWSADGVAGWTTYVTTQANATSFSAKLDLFNLPPIGGCFRVIAFNARGDSPPSNVACAEWGARPTDITARAVDEHSIDLAWTDNAAYEQGYLILRSTEAYGQYDIVGELPPNATRYRDAGLASGTEYWYIVQATYAYYVSDCSNCSDLVSATTDPAPGAASRIIANPRRAPIRIRGRGAQPAPPRWIRGTSSTR